MDYSVRIKRSAAKELAGVAQPHRSRLIDAIDDLPNQPLAGAALKGGMRGLRRMRIGSYRVIYEVLDGELLILVIRIAHRSAAYRRR